MDNAMVVAVLFAAFGCLLLGWAGVRIWRGRKEGWKR